jgi:hypothetical protein
MTSANEVLNQKRNQYEPAFHLLVQDFQRVCKFIEPADAHVQVFSRRPYELLLRASTEFECLRVGLRHVLRFYRRTDQPSNPC